MKKPYTSNSNRLADVIAAIQALATYKRYKMDINAWAKIIEGDESKGHYWIRIFEEHPEFFRLSSENKKASLIWRRSYQKRYSIDKEEKISKEYFYSLSQTEKQRISRVPLNNSDISTLINTAINLHASELEHNKDSRWLAGLLIGIGGSLIMIVLGAALKVIFKI